MKKYLEFAEKIAREAGTIQMKGLDRAHKIGFKGEINIVTEVDVACEKLIIGEIKKRWPEHAILAEESGKSVSAAEVEYKWIIDPLDGTTNYAHGYRKFCVSIALEYKKEIVVGVVFDAAADEMFSAVKDGPATLNGSPIKVSPVVRLREGLLATGFAYDIKKEMSDAARQLIYMLDRIQAFRRDGAAALDLCYVASGRFDGFWERHLSPWDVAAGGLIIERAGGRVTDFAGRACTCYDAAIVASNGILHEDILSCLEEALKY
jgi:myo-inositol-1(or 4)-monophosphatase